jgi:hypothetical protein
MRLRSGQSNGQDRRRSIESSRAAAAGYEDDQEVHEAAMTLIWAKFSSSSGFQGNRDEALPHVSATVQHMYYAAILLHAAASEAACHIDQEQRQVVVIVALTYFC